MKYFDLKNNRIVFIEHAPTEAFWSAHWLEDDNFSKSVQAGAGMGIIKQYTQKFLKKPSRVLDAGCGIGQNIYGLKEWGYDAYGIDFTEKVVAKTKAYFPDLAISTQDVRKMNFPDNYFDGCWSVGVIEHFTEGYTAIITEARRVIKKDGYLFVTIPWFSPLRKYKARRGHYPIFSESVDMKDFYEFMLDEKNVIENIEKQGFACILKQPHDATKGIKDEVSFLQPIFKKIYNGRNIFYKGLRFLISLLSAKVAGHIILLVFKKNNE